MLRNQVGAWSIGALALWAAQAGEVPALTITLPDGPAAKAWAGVGTSTVPATPPERWRRLLADEPWSRVETWELWAELLAAPEAADAAAAERRAGLCLLARAHGRAADAWSHFAALSASPEWAAAVMPSLMPGCPAGTRAGAGGAPVGLEPGVVLTPLVPPSHPDAGPGDLELLVAEARGIQVGDARIALRVQVESGGVQIDVEHLAGGAADVAVLIPEPEGWQIRVEYNDWMVQDTLREPLRVHLEPDAEPVSLWGRFLERPPLMPGAPAGQLPAQLREGGLTLEVPANDPQRALLEAAAGHLTRLLQLRVRVVEEGAAGREWTGTRVRLGPPEERGRTLRGLVSAVERYLLAR